MFRGDLIFEQHIYVIWCLDVRTTSIYLVVFLLFEQYLCLVVFLFLNNMIMFGGVFTFEQHD